MSKSIIILGIESSCDDTAAAVIKDGKLLANIVATQNIHKAYGGVVPELASRAHQKNIIPVVDQALKQAGVGKHELSAIAFTRGPGLMGSLIVGISFAKAFALGLDIPLIEVNHMQGHILAHFIEEAPPVLPEGEQGLLAKPSALGACVGTPPLGGGREGLRLGGAPTFPFLCLTVSGGHTQIVLINDFFEMKVIGETIDDAAGEAFDKAAKIMGLPYPGGPLIDKYAKEGDPKAFAFSKPKVPDLNFSFSGLKTGFMNFINNETAKNPNFVEERKADICASIQRTIIDILVNKLKMAAQQNNITQIAIAGGVSANSELRGTLHELAKQLGWQVFIPKFEYCTDNAAMIAITGYYKYLKQDFTTQAIAPLPRYSLG
ncbi:MAG: tRNA (adenosine(37)-N6)-threonylcarbamoyltransferase complex transferase subunit TsaD [Bacteroidota bacterium]